MTEITEESMDLEEAVEAPKPEPKPKKVKVVVDAPVVENQWAASGGG